LRGVPAARRLYSVPADHDRLRGTRGAARMGIRLRERDGASILFNRPYHPNSEVDREAPTDDIAKMLVHRDEVAATQLRN